MVYHFNVAHVCCSRTDAASNLLLHGYIAVDLFFVLSGFTLAMVYGDTMLGAFSARRYADFLMRRIARVWPLLAFAVFLGVAIGFLKNDPTAGDWPTIAGDLAMLDGWNLVPPLGGPTWSVSTECAAYLLFPVLLMAALRTSRSIAAVVGVIAFLPLVWLAHTFHGANPGRHGILDVYVGHAAMPLLRCFAGFTLGLLTYRVSRLDGVMRIARRPAAGFLVLTALLAALCAPGSDLLIELLFPALVIMAYAETTPIARVLGSPVPYMLGVWSYSIYLIHQRFVGPELHLSRILTAYIGRGGAGLALIFSYASAIGLAAILFEWVEKPGRKLLTSFAWMRSRTPAMADREPLDVAPPALPAA